MDEASSSLGAQSPSVDQPTNGDGKKADPKGKRDPNVDRDDSPILPF